MTDTSTTDRAIESIRRQFAGGEHRLAGARASELVYGNRKKPDEKMMQKIEAEAPGISRYISVPEQPVMTVTDQGGDPLSKQPESDPNQNFRSNMSNAKAREEQNEIDDRLAAGRKRGKDQGAGQAKIGSTRLNPEGSSVETREAPAKKPSKA